MDAGEGRRRLSAALAASRTRGPPGARRGPRVCRRAAPRPARACVDYWVAAVPTSWNIVPNGRDAIMGMPIDPADSIFPTVVYRRYTPRTGGKPLPNAPRASADGLLDPRPADPRARRRPPARSTSRTWTRCATTPHSMHFHGVHYKPSSDGAYLPGLLRHATPTSSRARRYTYRLTRRRATPSGVWPYHDHSPSMDDSIDGGMFGMLSILGRHERAPDREFEVVFSPFGKFMAIDGRAFVGNTPVFHSTRRRPRAVGRDGDGLRLPHLPRPRPPLARRRRRAARHADRRAGRELPLPLARGGPRARGSTTATSRTT